MRLIHRKGDMFDADVPVYIIPVNCVATAGAGVAKQCTKLFPKWEEAYQDDCIQGRLEPGECTVYATFPGNYCASSSEHPFWLVNFPTKTHFNKKASFQIMELGFASLKAMVDQYSWKELALPRLGCGLGQLYWPEVKTLMTHTFRQYDIRLYVYEKEDIA